MPYTNKIKVLEESVRLVESSIDKLKNSDTIDEKKLTYLTDCRDTYMASLRNLRRAQYEESQNVDFGED